jgi:hypothetical protein
LGDAEKMSIDAMNTRRKFLGQEHKETMDSISMVASVYSLRG